MLLMLDSQYLVHIDCPLGIQAWTGKESWMIAICLGEGDRPPIAGGLGNSVHIIARAEGISYLLLLSRLEGVLAFLQLPIFEASLRPLHLQ